MMQEVAIGMHSEFIIHVCDLAGKPIGHLLLLLNCLNCSKYVDIMMYGRLSSVLVLNRVVMAIYVHVNKGLYYTYKCTCIYTAFLYTCIYHVYKHVYNYYINV